MPAPNMEAFDLKTFRCDKYVKKLVNECVGGSELQQRQAKIQSFSDQTSSSLKKHVYDNYKQFIETSKEISHLESEMYQLSHILQEQRNTLALLHDESLTDEQRNQIAEQESSQSEEEMQNKRAIAAIAEALPDFEVELGDKTFVHDGGLMELDTDTYRPICRLHMFLFRELLIIAKVRHDSKFELVAHYELRKVAVSNFRDMDGVRNVINLLTPAGSKYCQSTTIEAKTEWIEKFASAVKPKPLAAAAAAVSIPAPKVSTKKNAAPPPPAQATAGKQQQHSQLQKALSDSKSMSSDLALSPADSTSSSATATTNWGPDWLLTAPEEILTLIAQRHFDETLQLITEAEVYLAKDSGFYGAVEYVQKIAEMKTKLANVLLLELSGCQSRSLHAALRSSRRPLKLLASMGREREACGTLLRVCSSAIRTSQRQARRNNLGISELFFCDLAQVAIEFLKAFSQQAACVSTLVVWCNSELQNFASQLIKHYLNKGTHLEDVARCVEGVRKPCAQLTDIGLDLTYHMEGLLRNSLEQIIEESRVRLVETIGRTEEVWQPYNLQTTTRLRETLIDMEAMGIDMKSQVTGDTWINLTASTVNFCRHFLCVTESCGVLAKNETLKLNVEVLLKDLFMAQYNIQPSANMSVDLNFVARNKSYLSDVLLQIAMAKFQRFANAKCELLNELLALIQTKNSGASRTPVAKPRSFYKTDVI